MSTLPAPFARQASFTSFSTETAPTVGQNLEAELNAVKQSLDQTQARLHELQRDDGKLANLSVHPDSLSDAVRVLLAADGAIRGLWVTGLVYGLGDVIRGPDGITYLSTVIHVANASFAVDVNAGRWISIDSGITLDAALRADLISAAAGKGAELIKVDATFNLKTWIANLVTSVGSALVGFIHAGVGARAQTVQEKLRLLPLHVTDFKNVDNTAADPTGVLDSTTAVQRALDAITDGGTLVVNGLFRCTAKPTLTNKSAIIYGYGPMTGFLHPDCNALEYTTTDQTHRLVLRDFAIITDAVNTRTGLSVNFPSNAGSPYRNLSIINVEARGQTIYTKNWLTAFTFNNCAGSSADGLNVIGGTGAVGVGYLFTGYSVDFVMNSPKAYACHRAVKKDGPAEGIILNAPVFVNCNRGVSLNEGASSAAGVYFEINGGHINYYDIGIYGNWHAQCKVKGTLFYSQGAAAVADVYLGNCDYSNISDCTAMVKDGAASVTFAKLLSGTGVTVSDNNIAERTVGVEFAASTVNCVATGNKNAATTRYTDAGTGNVYEGRHYVASGSVNLTEGDAVQDFTAAVPAGIFAAAPRYANAVGVSFNVSIRYNPAGSTATSLSFTILTIDGGAIPNPTTFAFRFEAVE